MCPKIEDPCQLRVRELTKLLEEKDKEIDRLNSETANLRERVNQLLLRCFGASSERFTGKADEPDGNADQPGYDGRPEGGSDNQEQPSDSNQAANDGFAAGEDVSPGNPNASSGVSEPKNNSSPSNNKKRGGGRNPLAGHLPRVFLQLAYKTHCDDCGSQMRIIDTRIVEKLAVLPILYYVIQYGHTHTACPCCDDKLCCSAAEPSLVPGSQATPELLADLAINKVADGLPIHRQDQRAKRSACLIGRAKLNRWFVRLGLALVPFIKLLIDTFNEHHTGHIDETRLQVIKEMGKKTKKLSALFIRTGGPPNRRVMLVDYRPDKSEKTVSDLLTGFSGRNLVADMAIAFKNFVKKAKGLTLFACHDHCRRKFNDALQGIPREKQQDSVAWRIIELYKKLYAVEREAKHRSPRFRKKLRRRSRKILDRMYRIMDGANARPKSSLGKAIAYAQTHKKELYAYLIEPAAPISNILAEHVAKKIAIARKNFLFCYVADGAQALANIMTVVYTLELYPQHHLHSYLTVLFLELPKAETVEDLEALLPWNISPEEVARRINQRPKPFGLSVAA